MRRTYHQLASEYEIKQQLNEMGIDVMSPESRKEETMAQALEAFSSFILEEEHEKCQAILDNHTGESVGELQGGSDQHSIYRVLIPDDDNDANGNDAAVVLLKEFHSSRQGKRYLNVLTIERLKQYMLGMCERRTKDRGGRKYTQLGNFMFILQFGGPTDGQVRHIDNMVPNLQICLYMSSECPSTIVYAMDGPPITNGKLLVEHWEKNENRAVPELVKCILENRGDTALKSKWYTKFFAFWDSIDSNLNCFGKLYQPVSLQLSLEADPGTTLLAGGNEIHAGPPTVGPRMFAFAIGIPEEETNDNEDNDGEVQYSPVLLHIDFCCILFSILEHEYSARGEEQVREAKHFLLSVLLALVKDYPMKGYTRQIDEDRSELRN